MIRPVSLVLTLAIILSHLPACATHRAGRAPANEAAGEDRQLTGVTTTAGEQIPFDRPRPPEMVAGEIRPAVGAARIVGDSLIATVDGAPYRIALGDVREIWFEETKARPYRSMALFAAIPLGVLLILLIVSPPGT